MRQKFRLKLTPVVPDRYALNFFNTGTHTAHFNEQRPLSSLAPFLVIKLHLELISRHLSISWQEH
jgi:hypothetical protein